MNSTIGAIGIGRKLRRSNHSKNTNPKEKWQWQKYDASAELYAWRNGSHQTLMRIVTWHLTFSRPSGNQGRNFRKPNNNHVIHVNHVIPSSLLQRSRNSRSVMLPFPSASIFRNSARNLSRLACSFPLHSCRMNSLRNEKIQNVTLCTFIEIRVWKLGNWAWLRFRFVFLSVSYFSRGWKEQCSMTTFTFPSYDEIALSDQMPLFTVRCW